MNMKNQDAFVSATSARNNFFDLLERVKKEPFPVNITVKGVPEAVVMSKEEFDGLMATIETLSDSELMEKIRRSNEDIKAGKYSLWEDVKKELGLKGEYIAADRGNKKYVSGHTTKTSRKRPKKIR